MIRDIRPPGEPANPGLQKGGVSGKTEAPIFFAKNSKKVLDKGGRLWYISQARLRETTERAKRTLKTIQKKERAIQEEDSEDSKEFSTERC